MKGYIDFNTRLRTLATNDFEKDFYKLMNNTVFGKMMENIRRHRNIRLVNNRKDYLKQVMKPNFKSGSLLGKDLMSCELGKVRVVMNKPTYLGQVILDLSKLISQILKLKSKDNTRQTLHTKFSASRAKIKRIRRGEG